MKNGYDIMATRALAETTLVPAPWPTSMFKQTATAKQICAWSIVQAVTVRQTACTVQDFSISLQIRAVCVCLWSWLKTELIWRGHQSAHHVMKINTIIHDI